MGTRSQLTYSSIIRTPQSSSPYLRPFYEAFNVLTDSAKAYISTFPAPILIQTFPAHFSAFSTNFDAFARSACRALGSVNPTHTLKYQSTSSLAQSAKALEMSWWDCFLETQAMDENDSAPLFATSAAQFGEVFEMLQQADQVFKANRSSSEIARSELGVATLEPLVAQLRKVQELFQARQNSEAALREAAELGRVLFDRATPTFFKQPSELNWYRGQILSKIAEIREFNQAVVEFETIISALKSSSIRFELEIRKVFGALNLPFGQSRP
jgi:hypothetical protein